MEYWVVDHKHIFKPEELYLESHASTIECLSDGTLVAAWFGGTKEKDDDVAIWYSRYRDGRWEPQRKAADVEGVPCWNPVLYDAGDRLILFYKVGKTIPVWQTYYAESVDGGETWSAGKELVPGDFGGRGPVKNKCIRLRDGAILAPASTETETEWNCFTDRSEDNGHTWNRSLNVPVPREQFQYKGIIQPTLWQDDEWIVHMYSRSTEGAIYHSASEDGGRSWCEAKPTALPNNNSGIDLTRLDDGRLVLVYNPVSGNWGRRSPVVFSISEDNGKTWGKEYYLDHVPCEQKERWANFSYPAVISRGKDLYITYTWKRETIAFWHIRLA